MYAQISWWTMIQITLRWMYASCPPVEWHLNTCISHHTRTVLGFSFLRDHDIFSPLLCHILLVSFRLLFKSITQLRTPNHSLFVPPWTISLNEPFQRWHKILISFWGTSYFLPRGIGVVFLMIIFLMAMFIVIFFFIFLFIVESFLFLFCARLVSTDMAANKATPASTGNESFNRQTRAAGHK